MKFAFISAISLLAIGGEVDAFGRSLRSSSRNSWNSNSRNSRSNSNNRNSWGSNNNWNNDNNDNDSTSKNKWNDRNNWWEQTTKAGRTSTGSRSDDHLLLCSGYVGTVYGDPHVVTFDGFASSCQNEGEFVLVNSPGKIEIQAKFKLLSDGLVSVTRGVAIAQPGTDNIQVNFAEYDSGDSTTINIKNECPIHLYVGGKLQVAGVGDTITGDGYEITVTSSKIQIQFDDNGTPTSAVEVQPSYGRGACMFTQYYCLPSSDQDLLDNTIGLLGTPNDDVTDEWMTVSGEPMEMSSSNSDKYEYCSTEHCVYREVDSIFVHEDANGGWSFDDLENCSGEFPGEIDLSDPAPEIVEICGEFNEDCILDGIVFGPDQARKAFEAQDTTIAIKVSDTVVDTTPASDTSCPDDIILVGVDGDALYDQVPLVLVEQTGDAATLKIRTPSFEGVELLYIEYEEDFYKKCLSAESVSTAYSEEISITCPSSEHVALVSIVASDSNLDSELDAAEADKCCHADDDTNPKVKYTFQVSCTSQCPESDSRLLRGILN